MNINELQQIIYNAGIVGAGGAGFPTHKKISEKVETIIVNAVECEPLLKVDRHLVVEYLNEVVQALKILIDALNAGKAYIALKSKNIKYLKNIDELSLKTSKVEIKEIPDIYPAGDEVVLTYEVTGKIIPEGNIPLSVGVMVINIETLFNIYKALNGSPVTYKYVTVTGEVDEPVTLCVPVGTPVKKLLAFAGFYDTIEYTVVMGGPLMGSICDPQKEVVTKTTKGIIVLPVNHPLIQKKKIKASVAYKRASSACCQCRMCTDMCPRYLLGYSIEVHKTVRSVANEITTDTAPYLQSHLCSACGVCDYIACTQDIIPRAICSEVKNQMIKNNLRYTNGKAPQKVRNERQYRLLPSQRIIERCGLKKYDIESKTVETPLVVPEVRIPLKQHIGKPATPIVKVGEQVKQGQLIAQVAYEDLGANIHSSINGMVYEINDKEIIIIKN
ncbi:MAG: hypothetical protein PWR27_938 [Petroclostridium sp.]|jgi:Na+-translocating ferredoxin:NAD+ oxidoreductase RnfC subunit|nr:Respiratory-chain dehydrogenase domain 51 kDa subunit [Clostridia bacterium]MDK2810229.1 hypothetical protein [Petroclostridium sp.]